MMNRKRPRSSFNSQMHKDMLYYDNPPDFKLLSEESPSFAPFVHFNETSGNYSIDWNNGKAVKELTRCLLEKDFNVAYWDIPDGFLIPTVTSRLNYLHWINDLVKSDMKRVLAKLPFKPIVKCIDIGTGANCIYPLLGHKLFKWLFIASDCNSESIHSAEEIILKNSLTNEITLIHQQNPQHVYVNLPIKFSDKIMFSMCNPPFFDVSKENKHDNPHTDNEYNYSEVYCQGGELAFIKRTIDESCLFKENICWFTTLIGKKADLTEIRRMLKSLNEVKRVEMTTFYQGKTARWGIAWSYYGSYEDFMIDNIDCPRIRLDTKALKVAHKEI